MEPKPERATHEAEDFLAWVLRVGVLVAASVVIAGGTYYLVMHGGERPDYWHFVFMRPESVRLGSVLHGVAQGQSRSMIQLGLLLLIATPVARVFFAVLLFIRERSRFYAAVSTIVLFVLITSLTRA